VNALVVFIIIFVVFISFALGLMAAFVGSLPFN